MGALDPVIAQRVADVLALPVFRDLYGVAIDELRPGLVAAHIDLRPDLGHAPGWFHGTVTSALAETVGTLACATLLGSDVSLATIEQSIQFVGPAQGDRLIGRGSVVRAGRDLSFASAKIHVRRGDAKRLCATMTLTCRHGRRD